MEGHRHEERQLEDSAESSCSRFSAESVKQGLSADDADAAWGGRQDVIHKARPVYWNFETWRLWMMSVPRVEGRLIIQPNTLHIQDGFCIRLSFLMYVCCATASRMRALTDPKAYCRTQVAKVFYFILLMKALETHD